MIMEGPQFYTEDCFRGAAADFKPQKNAVESFAVDDLFDFSNEDMIVADGFFETAAGNSTDSSTVTAVDSTGDSHFSSSGTNFSHRNGVSAESHFTSELCVPYEEVEQLEWLSNFVEDSFATEQNNFHMISGSKPKPLTPDSSSSSTRPDSVSKTDAVCIPEITLPAGKARSKRSRAAPEDWSTRLLHVSTSHKTAPSKRRDTTACAANNEESGGRRCLHCASEKTPQWRTGPMGPKTLCNACGVRYKSGRLVPEYRPAASPTFVSAKHSNSHRKVLELRRQREMMLRQQQTFIGQSSIYGVSNVGDEFLIHPHGGHEFRRHMI